MPEGFGGLLDLRVVPDAVAEHPAGCRDGIDELLLAFRGNRTSSRPARASARI
jgi:hypothetical protein